ncbi:MAG TPA: YchF/TatD family DNA exonuclease [Candidatus Omnitrophota bacterium]|nr:YchF/TatD family DNA exonuclease [Candidatus Omnitrophota bacterium]HPS20432.1 YchF/TatD family DNA exonuclease [Candidatus Omnitrophota bacterium]
MRLVDTHCHLDLAEFDNDLDEVIKRAESSDVRNIVIPGIDLDSSKKAVAIASRHSGIFAACGIHPAGADSFSDGIISGLRELCLSSDKVVAIGEIGIDHYRDYSRHDNQEQAFVKCLDLARDLDLPVIIHCREAWPDLLRILKARQTRQFKGVVHCFSGDKQILDEVLTMGFYVSFAGNITYEKAKDLRDVAKFVPPEKLLIETDAPYLSPVPFRGKRNEPANVQKLVDIFSDIYALTKEDVARITTHNANQIFKLGLEEKGIIAYPIRDALYLNITNRCTNRCTFCTRDRSDFVKGHNLKLEKEPSADEVISAMGDISSYKEVVFCGFGEPTMRLDVLKKVAVHAKQKGKKVRVNTNGEGDLINSRCIVPELKGLVDAVAVSLNAPDAEKYDKMCRSVYGKDAYDAMLKFVKECKAAGIAVELTCLDIVGVEGVEACRKIAADLGGAFRMRVFNVVG